MIFGFLGINGSGKTTHLKYLHSRKPGKYLPDYPRIPTNLSAYELLWRVGKMRKIENARHRSQRLCEKLMIDGAFDRKISTYSAGNYKKTALATILLERGELLYLDEPLETVDALSTEIIFEIFKGLSQSGADIFLSTQDIALGMRSDSIKIFSNLEVIAEGPPRDVLGNDPISKFIDLSQVNVARDPLEWLL